MYTYTYKYTQYKQGQEVLKLSLTIVLLFVLRDRYFSVIYLIICQ